MIEPAGLGDESAAHAWLAGARRSADAHVERALAALNRTIAAQRVAIADASVREVERSQALVVRIGYGDGERVAEGRWAEAVEVPPRGGRRVRRTAALRPQERLAALLGGRDAPLACEELTLRARTDLDHERSREAALELRVALEAALVELDSESGTADLAGRLDQLRATRGAVGAAANAALHGPLTAESQATVGEVLARLEAALRARSAAGVGDRRHT